MSSIYDYFERGEIKKKDKDSKGNDLITYYYKCKMCLSKLTKDGLDGYKGITASRKTNSNLHTHLSIDCELHQKAKAEYEAVQKTKINSTPQFKRRLHITNENDDPNCSQSTPKKTLLNMNAIKPTPKYKRDHPMQLSTAFDYVYTKYTKYKYTKNLRKELYSSLERRFSDLLVDNDIFILSTLLDPIFGKRRIPLELRDYAIVKLKKNLFKISTRSELPLTVSTFSTKQTVGIIREIVL